MSKPAKARPLHVYLIAFAVALTMPFLIMTALTTHHYVTSQQDNLRQAAEDLNAEVVAMVDRDIGGKIAMLQALATSPALADKDYPRFTDQARQVDGLLGVGIVLTDVSGRSILDTRYMGIRDHHLAKPEVERPLRDRTAPWVSALIAVPGTNRHEFTVTVPVKIWGEVQYLLSATLPANHMAGLIKSTVAHEPYCITIADRQGQVIATDHGSGTGSVIPNHHSDQPEKGEWQGTAQNGKEVMGTYATSKVSGWVVRIGVEKAALEAPLRNSLLLLAGLAAALAVIGGLFAYRISYRLSKANQLLTDAAQDIGHGHIVEAPQSHIEEVNLVGAALARTSMALREKSAAVARAHRSLEMRVEERTRELAEKTATLQATLDNMDQGLIMVDADLRLVTANRRFAEMLDLPPDFMATRPHTHEIVSFLARKGEYASTSNEVMAQVGTPPPGGFSVFERERPNGSVLEVRTMTTPDGGVIRIYTDVTARRRTLEALEEAKERAESAARAKADFLANMSHELRTPLTAIIGASELLLSGQRSPERQRKYLEMQRDAGHGLLGIINDILDISKIEAGHLNIEDVPLSLREEVRSSAALVADRARMKGLTLRVDVAGDLHDRVLGDPMRLRQVLLNLLSNAVKFTEAGSVRIKVSPDPRVPNGIRFSVRDTGLGLSNEQIANLFNRFSQAESSTARRFGGTGLGLAICQRLVGLMGGQMEVASVPKQGSNFSFTVPMQPVVAGNLHVLRPSDAPVLPRRILLVDDTAATRHIIAATLEQAGHTVAQAEGGHEAVAAAQEQPFDVVLMDVNMPDMDGYEATRRLRAALGTKAPPVVALTACALPEDAERSLMAGMDAHVTKPVDWNHLYNVIDRVTQPTEQRAA